MSERELVARMRTLFPRIGDDAAVIGEQVITNDLLIEGVDFTLAIPLRLIARKSVAVNLSDLAAMGARPQYLVVALGIPPSVSPEALIDAIAAAAQSYGVEVIGGDLSKAEQLTISITAIGSVTRPLLRSGARSGDRLYLSRPIGASAAGLQLLQNGWTIDERGNVEPPGAIGYSHRELAASAIRRHVDPEPEVTLGLALAGIAEVTSCIDVSDGLSSDLQHLCDASGCGAVVERERLPVFQDLLASGPALGLRTQEAVLHGGEEYALLFTSNLREADLSSRLRRPVYAIGAITAESGMVLRRNGVGAPLEAQGFEHF
jgi:thiamine-monophosphate kinase